MTLPRFPEGHVAAVRSLAAGRASSVSDRERIRSATTTSLEDRS